MILENCKSKVLVVSLLLSLIRDQENTLIKKKIKVTSLMTTSVSSGEQLDEIDFESDFDQMTNKYLATLIINTKQK